MVNGKINKAVWTQNNVFSRLRVLLGKTAGVIVMLGFLIGVTCTIASEPSLPEPQVKALFLFNFTKYVDWPADVFADAKTPIVIGVLGDNKIGDNLQESVKGKSINGREIVIRKIEKGEALNKCHILFISISEKKHLAEILLKTKALPVLTVGETEQFIKHGGVINFVKKEDKIRLEINVDSATESKLQISSKLLNVADVVRGKK